METFNYNNKKRVQLLNRIIFITGMTAIAAVAILFYTALYIKGGIVLLLFFCMLILLRILNFHSVEISSSPALTRVRFYPLFSFDRDYSSIEFKTSALYDFQIKKSIGALKRDLVLVVIVKGKSAAFPSVCLSAVPASGVEKIRSHFAEIAIKK